MSLRDILDKIATEKSPVLLCDAQGEWKADELLTRLSEFRLKMRAHIQPGMYIAEIDPAGYLGPIIYRIKPQI